MAGALSLFKNDTDLETGGVNLIYADTKIKIARAGGSNKRFATVLERRSKPHRRAIDMGLLDEKTSARLMVEVYAEAVILGWENMLDPATDKPIPFTFDNCVQVMTDYPDLFQSIVEEAKKLSNFQQVKRETEAGN